MGLNKTIVRQYLRKDFDATDKKQVEDEFKRLEDAKPEGVEKLEAWITHWEELSSAIGESYSRASVAVTVDTTDSAAETRFMRIASEILPVAETCGFNLGRKLLAHKDCDKLPAFYANYMRALRADVEIYREENVALKVEERKLVNEFEKIMGGLSVKFRGEEMTMQQCARFLEDPDQATRKESFEARAAVRNKIAPELDDLYGRMFKIRDKIATNAGFKNFRDYQFKSWHRFDYTPEDCFKFHDAIARTIVPVVAKIQDRRKEKLGVKTLKPWDTVVDPDAKTPIQPFEDVEQLVSGCRKIFHKVDADLGKLFDHMVEENLLDLDSRKGKAPGGYCTQFSESKDAFIFMNAAGTRRDVDTLLHEGGHSFHYYLASKIPLASYHHTGLEFAEVASMSMELLSRPHLGEFYPKDVLPRVLRDQLQKVIEFFPFMAMIDAFQHWVYTSKTVDPKAWRSKWTELAKRYQPDLDWSGYEHIEAIGWQYPHVFSVPFYYVEYGIAQLGALSVWARSLENVKEAVEGYKAGLSLGATKTLPELFKAVGARFGMEESIIAPLVKKVEQEIFST